MESIAVADHFRGQRSSILKQVLIIGAGPAGLTAGYELLKQSKDYAVTILEETATFGGISRTVEHNGNRMDIGGHRFFSKDERVTQWWAQILPNQGALSFDDKKLHREAKLASDGPDPEREDRVMLFRNRISRIYYKHKFFDYPVKLNFETIKNMGVATTLLAGFSYLKAVAKKLPETSLENFYINRFGKQLYSMFFEGYTEKLWGRHPRNISADWGSQRVKGLSIVAVLKDVITKLLPGTRDARHVETSLIESFNYPKYGPGQLWETVAADFIGIGGTIRTHCKAVSIVVENSQVRKVVCEENGQRVELDADIVISSMPLKELVEGMNGVPDDVKSIAQGLPYRDFVTVGVLVDRLNLQNKTSIKTLNNIIPDNWIYVQDTGIKLGRIQVFNNWSPYLVKDPEHTVWIGLEYFCTENDNYWNMSKEEWLSFATEELVCMHVLDDAKAVKDYHVEFVKKAYPAYFDTYAQIDKLVAWLNKIDNLYCVGRNGQHRYNNMDHSMATSFEAVSNILSGRKDKSNIWSVNTEKEYHESK